MARLCLNWCVKYRVENQSQDDTTLLLIIDQAEELFVVSDSKQAGQLLGLLRSAIEQSDGRLMVFGDHAIRILGQLPGTVISG